MRVLIGGVDYPDLSDHSAGLLVTERLAASATAPGVVIEDLSFNPVAVAQRLQDEPAEGGFDGIILVSAVPRGRAPGSVTAYRWDGVLPPAEEVQRAVCDAVTGIIHVDNTLIVTRQFGGLPGTVAVIEIEPLIHDFGERLSPAVEAAVNAAVALAAGLSADPALLHGLPVAPLGGPPVAAVEAS